MILYQFLAFLIIVIGVWLALWVYSSDRKSKINQLFSLFTLSFLLWAPLPYFFNLPLPSQMAMRLVKFGYGIVSLFLVAFYFFTTNFPQKDKEYPFLDKIIILIGFLLFYLAVFTNQIVENIEFTKWGVNPIFGTGKIFYFGSMFFLTLVIMALFFKKYFTIISKKERVKIQYILIGLIIFVASNLIFNVMFPFLGKTAQVQYYPLGNYSAIFLLAFTAYAIVKQELFGIKVVLTALLVGLIALLTIVDILFLTNEILAQLFKSLLLVAFLYFGYLLIQSVMREIQYRERLQKVNKQLKKLDRAKSEFISIASHQLRTPLSVVKGYVSMLSEGTYGNMPLRSQKPIRNVYRANERLIKLVNDLLSLSRIESGKIEIKLNKASLQEIISNLVEDLKTQAHNKNIYLTFDKPKTSLPNILIDEAKIKEVISNIIDNAIKYTAKGGVTITLRKQKLGKQEKAIIEIKDTGLGMTKREISKIFESFSRGTAGVKLYTGGAGLGLYIAKKFANMHGGDIKAISEGKGKGSTFYIELPIK